MSGRFLLDTNIVIALFANEPALQLRLSDAGEVSAPFLGFCLYFNQVLTVKK